ncbi:MAG TPA: Wzz/FepE/Etk N-terminal domain-containing protein [Gammaproteobacteria bacterium]|nr:Wzz/FepE/Etk N-terminal domain-containing protein [Gammaproteobacteria bacterium]
MNAALFWSALRARRAIFLAVLAVTVVVATAVSLVLPKSYRSTASLVLDRRNEQSIDQAFNALVSPNERLGYIQTQVDVITSPKVARRVVEEHDLAARPESQEEFAARGEEHGSIEEWLAEGLLEDLDVETSQSSVIDLSFVAATPTGAAEMANGFAKAYMDTTLELQVEPARRAAEWFDDQLQTLRADLERAQATLNDYQRSRGIVSAEGDFDIEQEHLADLSEQLLRAQERTMILRDREGQARAAMHDESLLEQLPEVEASEQIGRLKGDLLEGEAQLEVLATQYGSNYPAYRRQVAENTARRQRIAAEMAKIVGSLEAQRRESERREVEIERAIEAQRALLLESEEGRDQLAILAGDVKTAQSAYETAMQRYVVTQVDGRASQTNVALLSAAVVPTRAYRPNLRLNVALSLVVGVLLGIGVVIAMELADRRVRTMADLDWGAEVPLLGTLGAWRPPDPLGLPGPGRATEQPEGAR